MDEGGLRRRNNKPSQSDTKDAEEQEECEHLLPHSTQGGEIVGVDAASSMAKITEDIQAVLINSFPIIRTASQHLAPVATQVVQGFESVWASLAFLPQNLNSLLKPVLNLLGDDLDPAVQAQVTKEVQALRDHVSQCYDANSEDHEKCLRLLWDFAFPTTPLPERETKEWGKLGFQGKDPATDFRGAGIFGLCNLLYLAHHYPSAFYQFVHNREYPFAIAGLSMTNVLFECLGFGMRPTKDLALQKRVAILLFVDDSPPPSSPPSPSPSSPSVKSVDRKKCLWGDILSDKKGWEIGTEGGGEGEGGTDGITHFNEMFCFIFFHLDENWVKTNATYMDFPAVLKTTKEAVEQKFLQMKSIKDIVDFNRRVASGFPALPPTHVSINPLERFASSSSSIPSSSPSSPSSSSPCLLDTSFTEFSSTGNSSTNFMDDFAGMTVEAPPTNSNRPAYDFSFDPDNQSQESQEWNKEFDFDLGDSWGEKEGGEKNSNEKGDFSSPLISGL